MEFYIIKDYEKIENVDYDGNFNLSIKNQEFQNVIFNVKILANIFYTIEFGVVSVNKNRIRFSEPIA